MIVFEVAIVYSARCHLLAHKDFVNKVLCALLPNHHHAPKYILGWCSGLQSACATTQRAAIPLGLGHMHPGPAHVASRKLFTTYRDLRAIRYSRLTIATCSEFRKIRTRFANFPIRDSRTIRFANRELFDSRIVSYSIGDSRTVHDSQTIGFAKKSLTVRELFAIMQTCATICDLQTIRDSQTILRFANYFAN